MLNNKYYLGSYYKEDSKIHKLNPKIKIITLFMMIISIIISKSIQSIILLNTYILTMILYSDINLKIYLKHLIKFKIIILITGLITLILTLNICNSIYSIIKIIDIILLLLILLTTTTPLEINSGLTNLLKNKFINLKKFILNITLCIIAIPLINETKEQIIISKSIRGISKKDLTIKEKIKIKINNTEQIYRLTKNRIKRISNIMDIKNYSYNLSRTNYKLNKNKKLDTIVLLLDIIIFILAIVY